MSLKLLLIPCFCLFSVFIPVSCFAQAQPGDIEMPDPLHQLQPFFYPDIKKPVKSFCYIIDKDTILKSSYDNNGNELSKLDYEGNKPVYKSLNTYSGNLKTETVFFINNILQSTTTYKYDARKNLVDWKRVKTVYDKKTQTSTQANDIHWFFKYNGKDQLESKFSIDGSGIKNPPLEYAYDASGKLSEVNELQWKNVYEYKNGLLTGQQRLFKNDNSVYASSAFTYNESNVLTGSSDKNSTAEYNYDNNRLKKIIYRKKADQSYQDIELNYNGDALSKVEITTNDIRLKPAFIFKSDYLYFAWSKTEPNKLKMEFAYDKHNNIAEIKYFIKDVYQYSKLFIYTYY